MAYRIVENGMMCIEGGEEKSWKQVYIEIEKREKSPAFTLDLRTVSNLENDDLGWVLDFGLCMWVHWGRTFYLNVQCSDNKLRSIENKYANFLRFFIDKGMLKLTINRRLKTTDKVKNEVPDAFFPMLIVDQKTYSEWFLKPISDISGLKHILCGDDMKEQESFYSEMAMRICRKMLYSKANYENEKIKKRLEEIYEEYLKSHSVMTVLLACILYNRFRQGIPLTGTKAITLLKQTIGVAYIYKLGLQEVCENILRHTYARKGIIYLRTLSGEKTRERFIKSAGWSEENVNKDSFIKICDKWLEMTIIDAGEKGILETQKNKRSLLETFEWSRENSGVAQEETEEIAEIDALIYHKGLKIFNSQIQLAKGMFFVQTINGDKIISYSRKADEEGKVGAGLGGLGTQYKIWLPMAKVTGQFQKSLVWGNEEIADGYRAYQSYNADEYKELLDILYKNVCVDYKIEQKISGMSVKSNALSECRKMLDFINQNRKFFYYFNFEDADPEYAIKLIYFLALTANEQSIRYMILYNVDQNIFKQFILNYQTNVKSKWAKKEQKNYFFVFNKQGTPIYITNDFDDENSERLKMYLWVYRGIYCEGITEASLSSGISSEDQSAVLLPVEILNASKERNFSAPIFESHMRQLFENQMSDSEKFGLQYVGHVNLGDKIHVRKYYQGELLFDNNYYLGALAYILARALGNKKKFFLVGYKKYSVGLLNKMKEYMGANVEGMYIFDKIDKKNEILNVSEGTEIVVIVPIASTLRTFEKVERFLRKQIIGDYEYSYYAFFVSRDQDGDVTDLEREFKWKSIGNDYIILESEWPLVKWNNQREIRYFMMLSGGWQHAMKCEQCDEIRKLGADIPPMEALMETGEDSLNLKVKLGIPYNEDPDGFECYTKYMDEAIQRSVFKNMSKYIIEGHFERSENHFKHYLFCGKFFEEYLKECKPFDKWLEKLKEEFQKENQEYVNILLVPDHYSNNMLSKHVNKRVFSENTIIINENFYKEFYSDFTKKYNYLKKLRKIRYVFLDDCVNTGNTWKKVYSLVSRLGEGEKKYYIISLVNRLDYSNKVLLAAQGVECRFFTEISIPSIKEQNGNCWLCEESKHLKCLYKDSFSYEMKQFYANKILKIAQFNIEEEEEEDFKEFRGKKKNTEINFLITNELYRRMFDNYQLLQEGKTENFRKYFGVASNYTIEESIIDTEVDYKYKMAFVKTLSRPFINNFAGLRNFCVNVCMMEFQKLMEESICKSIDEVQIQLKYLIVLIKRLGTLHCRYILKKECFEKVLNFYNDRRKWSKEISARKLALHYAVAVKQMMLESEVNTLRFLENFQKELMEPSNVIMTDNIEEESVTRCFLKNVFFSKDIIVENAIRNYRTDYEVLKRKRDFETEEKRVLDNHTYGYYQRELACFKIKEKEKGNAFLAQIKKIEENIGGDPAQFGGMENVGFKPLVEEALGEIEDFRVYFYQGSKKGKYYNIKGRELDAPQNERTEVRQNDPTPGIELWEYINWVKQEKQMKLAHLVSINNNNIWTSGKEIYINIAMYEEKNVTGLIFTGKIEIFKCASVLILYRLLCGMGVEMIKQVAKIKGGASAEEHEKLSNDSVKKLRKE